MVGLEIVGVDAVVAEIFVDLSRFVAQQCCSCDGRWFVGCCGLVVVFCFSNSVVFQYVVVMANF